MIRFRLNTREGLVAGVGAHSIVVARREQRHVVTIDGREVAARSTRNAALRIAQREAQRLAGEIPLPGEPDSLRQAEDEAMSNHSNTPNCRVNYSKIVHAGAMKRNPWAASVGIRELKVYPACAGNNQPAAYVFETSDEVTCKRCLASLALRNPSPNPTEEVTTMSTTETDPKAATADKVKAAAKARQARAAEATRREDAKRASLQALALAERDAEKAAKAAKAATEAAPQSPKGSPKNEAIVTLHHDGRSLAEIAEQLSVSTTWVRKILSTTPGTGYKRQSRNPERDAAIAARFAGGETKEALAAEYGIGSGTITAIANHMAISA